MSKTTMIVAAIFITLYSYGVITKVELSNMGKLLVIIAMSIIMFGWANIGEKLPGLWSEKTALTISSIMTICAVCYIIGGFLVYLFSIGTITRPYTPHEEYIVSFLLKSIYCITIFTIGAVCVLLSFVKKR